MGSSFLKPQRYQAKFNAMNLLQSFKDTRLIRRVMVILVLLVFSIKSELIAQADYNCYIKNIVQTAPNTLEFDIWLESTGPDTFKLTFIQAGVDFNLTGIANGGALTGIMVPGSADPSLPASQQTHSIQINTTSNQYRIAASVANAATATTMIPPAGMNLGTFRITNTVPFTTNSTPDFQWSFIASTTQTQTAVGAYINGATIGTNITNPARHFVLGNPVLNQIANPSSAVLMKGTGPDTICVGASANLKAVITGGVSPYQVIYFDGQQNDTVFNYTSGNDITVTPLVTTSYNLVAVYDNSGNPALANSGIVSVIVKNNNTISLATIGNAQSITGTVNGSALVSESTFIQFIDAECNRICAIEDLPGGNAPGQVFATVTVENALPTINGQPYTSRWFNLIPTINQNLSTRVSLFFTLEDFVNYNAANGPFRDFPVVGNAADPAVSNIRVIAVDLNNQWSLIQPQVNWDALFNHWEIRFQVSDMQRYALTSINPDTFSVPAQLVDFWGQKLATSDELFWTSSQEKNMAEYRLYHSTDNANYSLIKTLVSKAPGGNSTQPLNYKTLHVNPQPGHNYYKLQLVDQNNTTWFHSKIVDLFRSGEANPILVYPSGSNSYQVDYYSETDQEIIVRTIDMSGRTVRVQKNYLVKGPNTFSLSLDGLARGIYNLQFIAEGKRKLTERVLY
ncbi:MAG: hypothetical protein JNM44_06960 [Chitinophagaceae bacterium]|nr:hypothetical protein [Chitinophagaceae bacterium]